MFKPIEFMPTVAQPGFIACLVLLASLSAESASAVDIRLTPVLASAGAEFNVSNPLATEVTIDPGDLLKVEVQVRNWAPELVRGVQAELRTSSLVSGGQGYLSFLQMDVDHNGMCDAGLSAYCPICDSDLEWVYIDECRNRCGGPAGAICNPGNPAACGGNVLNCFVGFGGHPDFFGRMPPINGLGSGTDTAFQLAMAWSATAPVGAADDGHVHYVGTYVFKADVAARGTFTLRFWPDGASGSAQGGTFVRNQLSQPFSQATNLGKLTVQIRVGQCCNPNDPDECYGDLTESACAALAGTWNRNHICDIDPCVCEVDANCNDGILCTFDTCVTSECANSPFLYADVNADGFRNSDDTLCLLDTFGGVTNPAACLGSTLTRRDIAPCPRPLDANNMGEGVVNSEDVLAVLDAFAGIVFDPDCACTP